MRFLPNSLLCFGALCLLSPVTGFAEAVSSDTLVVFGIPRTIPEPAGGDAVPETSITIQVPGVVIGNFAVELTDRDGISDLIIATTTPNNVSAISLFSDPASFASLVPPGYKPVLIPETGALQDLSAYFRVGPGQILAQSDLEPSVPEPGTILVFGILIAALVLRFRWRNRVG